eukprot:CAMPEP_0197386976 /NCGR_PEP_ID=MMETSP1165-20131217/239_1 /TAXON_ID=284809 /ORGANISM="Chrysocystis fragilis, Strain CCMP3189" /LENGTH=472 /DNA_ID=CAMNT_0042912263 /DNA_START=199 /DNA_END=1617 /DNA_ORIENTATION=-
MRDGGRRGLVLLAEVLLLALALGGLGADLLVVLLEGGKILAGLGELALLHALADVPVDEGALGVHEVELVVDAGEGLGDGGGVGDHADGAHDAGEVAAGDDRRRLVVDAALEAGGAPVDELDGALGLDGGDRGVDVLGDDVAAVHEAAGHVLAVARVALGHHAGGLEDRVGDLGDRELLVVGLFGGDDGGVRGEHEVDARVGDEVGLELGDVDVERAVEAERGGERRGDLGEEAVQVGVGGALDVEVAAADVVEGLVVEAERDVGVLEEGVGREHRVVGLDDGVRDLGRGGDAERELGLAAVVDREALEDEGAEAGPSAAARGVERQETLEARAVVGELADAVEDEVDDLLADRVVAAGVVVRGVLLARDDLLGVVQLPVRPGADLVAHGRLEVDVDRARDVLPGPRLREEGVERVVPAPDRLVRGHLAIGLDPVLEAEQLPAGVAALDTALADVDADALAHDVFLLLSRSV